MTQARDMDRYEKRAREIANGMNERIRSGTLISGSQEYSDLMWLTKTLFKASKTYKQD